MKNSFVDGKTDWVKSPENIKYEESQKIKIEVQQLSDRSLFFEKFSKMDIIYLNGMNLCTNYDSNFTRIIFIIFVGTHD